MLASHPAVTDAGVISAEESTGLVKPFAFVVLREATGKLQRFGLAEFVRS